MIVLLVSGIIYIPIAILVLPPGSNLRRMVSNLWTTTTIHIICLISTFWVHHKHKVQCKWNAIQHLQIMIDDSSSRSTASTPNSMITRVHTNSHSERSRNSGKDSRLSLEEILGTKNGFDAFANHLVREFSVENLFFLFEMMQIKDQCVNNQFGSFSLNSSVSVF